MKRSRPAGGANDLGAGSSRSAFPAGPDRLVEGDNLALMRRLPDECLDLVYLDPPFGTGKRRSLAGRPRSGYPDVFGGGMAEYVGWLEPRLAQARRLLKATGSLVVHLDWHSVHYVKVALDGLFGPETFQAEIVWCYETGGASKTHFPRKHDTLLHYGKSPGIQYHPQTIVKVLKHRMMRKGVEEFFDDKLGRWCRFKLCPDWWTDIDVVRADSSDRVGYPTEKPPALIERILRATTREGDAVGDFFCGSGTTPLVAARLGRRWIACDIARPAIEATVSRLAGARVAFSRERLRPIG